MKSFFTFGRVVQTLLDHPLFPGSTSAVEKGPWHYGADYVAVYFDAKREELAELLPKPFEVDTGRCIAYVCEIISVAEGGEGMVATEPDRTVYQEAAVGVGCRFGERKGVFYPVMWVTTEWSLLRGLINGYQKRLADRIAMTKVHPMNPALRPTQPGMKFTGFCVKGAEKTMSLDVTIRRQGATSDLPAFGATFGLRRYPKTDESQAEILEPVEILKSNSRSSDVWLGEGNLATTLPIGGIRMVSGSVYKSGFTISGSRVLKG